jgi:hypothetical protein
MNNGLRIVVRAVASIIVVQAITMFLFVVAVVAGFEQDFYRWAGHAASNLIIWFCIPGWVIAFFLLGRIRKLSLDENNDSQ